MTAPEKTQIASHAATIALCIVVGVCAVVLTVAVLRITDGGQQALATVNQGCAPGPCGTLAAIAKAVTKGGDAIVTTQMQELAVVKQVSPVLDSLATIAPHANGMMDEIAGTANAASGGLATLSAHTQAAIDTANSTLGTLNERLGDVQKQQDALDKSIADFDTVLNGIPPIEDRVKTDTGLFETTIGTTNHMLFTFDAVETKATHSYLHPPHGAAAIWPTIRPFLLPITQVGGAVAIEVAK